MKIVSIVACIAVALLLCSCGAAQVLTPVMTPAIEASVPLPASEAAIPLPTAEPKTEPTNAPTAAQQTAEPADAEVKLFLNGNRLVLTTPPQLADGAVLVPVAEVCASFSRDITAEDGETGLTLTDAERNRTIVLKAGTAEASLNGKVIALDVPCVLAGDGALLMPLSAFRALFDADNKFVQEFSSAYIVESGLC